MFKKSHVVVLPVYSYNRATDNPAHLQSGSEKGVGQRGLPAGKEREQSNRPPNRAQAEDNGHRRREEDPLLRHGEDWHQIVAPLPRPARRQGRPGKVALPEAGIHEPSGPQLPAQCRRGEDSYQIQELLQVHRGQAPVPAPGLRLLRGDPEGRPLRQEGRLGAELHRLLVAAR